MWGDPDSDSLLVQVNQEDHANDSLGMSDISKRHGTLSLGPRQKERKERGQKEYLKK